MIWLTRIAAVLGGIIALAAATLLVLGQFESWRSLEASIEIARPPAQVWPFLYEEAKLKQWVTWLVEAKPSVEPTPGARGRWVMRDENNGGALMNIDSVVTAVEPARRLEVDLDVAGEFTGHGEYELIPAGSGTRVITRQRYQFNHWFPKLMMPLVTVAAGRKLHSDLALMKKAVEAN
ncbi:MAG: SRPBCC family protein [Bryobacterales bacterium]|nr:SRPBCC family protein [Bryobacterales bacterium]